MKTCSRCKEGKQDDDFRWRLEKRSSRGDNFRYLNNTCRLCDSEISRIYYLKNRSNPDFMSKQIERVRIYGIKNKEIIKVRQAKKRQSFRYKENRKKYINKNKERILSQEAICKERYYRKHSECLTDEYITQRLLQEGLLNREILKNHHEIIQAKKLQILIKRQLKTKNNGN